MTGRELSQAVHLKAELHDSARKVYASNVERGRYGPYWKLGLRPLFSKESCCKVDTRLLEYSQGN